MTDECLALACEIRTDALAFVAQRRAWEAHRNERAVLVVEDDEQIQRLLRRTLSEPLAARGVDLVIVESAREAMRAVEARAFAVAVLDLMLPGMSGMELADRLRPALVLCSGIAEEALEEMGRACRADATVSKDQRGGDYPRALLAAIELQLEARATLR